MTRDEFIVEIEDIISADEGTLTAESKLCGLEDWDSLAVISFIAMADKKLSKKADVASIKECQTVEDLMKIVGV